MFGVFFFLPTSVKELQKTVPLKANEQQFRLIDLMWKHNLERWREGEEAKEYNRANPSWIALSLYLGKQARPAVLRRLILKSLQFRS